MFYDVKTDTRKKHINNMYLFIKIFRVFFEYDLSKSLMQIIELFLFRCVQTFLY